MSFIGDIFGAKNNFSAQGAGTPQQAEDQYQSLRSAQGQQQALVDAMRAQGGIQNQSNVFQQQQQLAQQLQQQTLGQGPNPAQAMLAQQTGQNVQQQAALMAGQRGASQNAGLMARQAAQQGGQMQQQATGQAATMQANQQLAAQQQLQQQQAAMAGLAGQQVGQQQQAVGQLGNFGLQGYNAVTGNINQQNQLNAGIAQNNADLNGAIMGGLIKGGAAAMTGGMSEAGPAVAGAAGGGGGIGAPQRPMVFASGGKIPGQAPVAGDSPQNDIVHAKLSPGELVIPRSVVEGGPKAILAFAQQVLEQGE